MITLNYRFIKEGKDTYFVRVSNDIIIVYSSIVYMLLL